MVASLQPPSVLESSLYCPDLDAAEYFYRDVLGLEVVTRQAGRHVFLRLGGYSLYFRDPAGNSLELATAALWGFAEQP